MKRLSFFFLSFSISLFSALYPLIPVPWSLPSVYATEASCWCIGANAEKCTLYSDSCPSGDATNYEGFSICCNDKNLYNSEFALKSPICGSAIEKPILGCETGTFKDGNSMMFCVGNEFRRGATDSKFDGKDNVAFDPGGSFTYNGNSYSAGNVYVCNSIASCCANTQLASCKDIYTPSFYDPPSLTDNNSLPNNKRAELCGLSNNPNDDNVRYVHSTINEYEVTCADTPVVEVVRDTCSEDAGGSGAPYGKITQVDPLTGQDYVDIQALVNLIGTKLGGYGPDEQTAKSKKTDILSKIYPYNALAGKPFVNNAPREAFGTFYRLTNQISIMNAKAKIIQQFKSQIPPIKDQDISYSDANSQIGVNVDGAALADYMNEIIKGVSGDAKIKLLSPAFNITSRYTPPLIKEMTDSGAKFGDLAGCAGNTYTVSGKGAYDWYKDFLTNTGLGGKCNFIFTEFGDFDTFGKSLDNRPFVISAMKQEYQKTIADPSVISAIYFNALGGNPDFTGHQLSKSEYLNITSSNPAKAGVNSALAFSNGEFAQSAAAYTNNSGWNLEIAFSPGDVDSVANSINAALAHGMTTVVRVCVGNSCDFADPDIYVKFLKDVSAKASGPFYALAGPNEPETEQWVEGKNANKAPIKLTTIKLSDLIRLLPSCLTSNPVCDTAIDTYNRLDRQTRIQYDAFIPFNQDSLRGYLALNYIEPVEKRTNVGILTEGLSYVESIKQALDDSQYGIIRDLSPQWLIDARAGLSTSNNYITPQQEKGNLSIIEAVGNRAKNTWNADTIQDNPRNQVFGCFSHKEIKGLPAPTTFVQDFQVSPPKTDWQIKSEPFTKSLYQFLRVPVKTVEESNSQSCPIRNRLGKIIGYGTHYVTTTINGSGKRDEGSYLVSDIGRSIAVLNNPKMTDISRLISEPKDDQNYSLNNQLLAQGAQKTDKYADYPLVTTGGTYDSTIYVHTDPPTKDKAKAGNKDTTNGQIARKGGTAHADLCVLRNYWLTPSGLQKGKPESCTTSLMEIGVSSSTTKGPSGGFCSVPGNPKDNCSPNNPDNNLTELFGDQADNAAAICNRESGGIAENTNTHCLDSDPSTHTVDYSVGLFQINMLAHPNPAFYATTEGAELGQITGNQPCYKAFSNYTDYQDFDKWGNVCQISDPVLLNKCVAWFQIPKNNLAYAKFLVTGGGGSSYDWSPWATATGCNIK